jgi:hypothetical protein
MLSWMVESDVLIWTLVLVVQAVSVVNKNKTNTRQKVFLIFLTPEQYEFWCFSDSALHPPAASLAGSRQNHYTIIFCFSNNRFNREQQGK